MADAPDSPEPSRPAGFPSPDDLRGRDIAAVDPPKTDAAAVAPAPPSAGPYRLSGPSDVARGGVDDPVVARTPESALKTSSVVLRPKKAFAPAAARARFGARDRNRAARRSDRGRVRARRAPVDAGRRLPHQLRPDGHRTRRDRRRARAGAGDAADRRTRTCHAGPCRVGHQGAQGLRGRSRRRLGEGDRPAGRFSARAIEQAPGAGEAIPVQPCHRGIRVDGDRHQRRHDGRALAAVPPRDACRARGAVSASSGRSRARRS